jgi:hypothetical protein
MARRMRTVSEFTSAYADPDRDGERLHAATEKVLESWGAPRDPETGKLVYSAEAYTKASARASDHVVRADKLERALLELDGTAPVLDDGVVHRDDIYDRAQQLLDEAGNDAPDEDDWNEVLKRAIEEVGRPGQPRKVSSARARDKLLDAAEARGGIAPHERASWADAFDADPKATAKLVAGLEASPTFAKFARRTDDGTIVEGPDVESSRLHETVERLLEVAGFTGAGGAKPYAEQDYASVLAKVSRVDVEWRDTLESGVSERDPYGTDRLVLAIDRESGKIVRAIKEGVEPPAPPAVGLYPTRVSGPPVRLQDLPEQFVVRAREALNANGHTDPSDALLLATTLGLVEEWASARVATI